MSDQFDEVIGHLMELRERICELERRMDAGDYPDAIEDTADEMLLEAARLHGAARGIRLRDAR